MVWLLGLSWLCREVLCLMLKLLFRVFLLGFGCNCIMVIDGVGVR